MPKKVFGLSSAFIKQYNKEIEQEEKRMRSRKTRKTKPKKKGGEDYADDSEGTVELNGFITDKLYLFPRMTKFFVQ